MRLLVALLVAVSLTSCSSDVSIPANAGERMLNSRDYAGALDYYRGALASQPDDPGLRAGYYRAVEETEEYFLSRSRQLAGSGNISQAEGAVGQGLLLVPESSILRNELQRLDDLGDARKLYRDANVAARLGRRDEAFDLVERALAKDPELQPALRLLQTLSEAERQSERLEPIRLESGAPVSINFQNAAFKDAALALGRAYGVNMIFDADLQDRTISVYADRVSFPQAFTLLLKSNDAFYRRLGENSVVIAPDTPTKRAEYEDYVVRTFFIESGDALAIADRLSTTLELRAISVDEAENTITVRDSVDRVLLADQLISVQDRRPAEVVMEVEVLEINRTKSEQLGLDFGSEITITPPSDLTLNNVFPVDEFGVALGASAISLPPVALRYFKQDVDARTLASPRIRTLNKQSASFLVGDEVPLRVSEVIDATGQTRTTFEYRGVGILLDVTPEVRLNSSVAVDLSLEVSTLGQNLGTSEDQAFVIGTRNIQTRMLLDDGETAIIGGLIRDEDRQTMVKVPGLGDIPVVGNLFRQRDASGTRTDIILTLTPRVVRARDLPSVAEAEFFSGTGERVTGVNPNDFLAGPRSADTPVIRLDLSGAVPSAAGRVPLPPRAPADETVEPEGAEPVLSFSRGAYTAAPGETVTAVLTAAGFPTGTEGIAVIRYRNDIVTLNAVTSEFDLPVQIDNTRGQVLIELTGDIGGLSVREIARLEFTADNAGLSYLIFGNAVGPTGARNLPPNTALRNSRIVVR